MPGTRAHLLSALGQGPQAQAQGLQVLRAGLILAICLELRCFRQDKSGSSSRKPTGLN